MKAFLIRIATAVLRPVLTDIVREAVRAELRHGLPERFQVERESQPVEVGL